VQWEKRELIVLMSKKRLIPLIVILLMASPVFAVGEDGATITIGLYLLLGIVMLFLLPFLIGDFTSKKIEDDLSFQTMMNDSIKRGVLILAAAAYLMFSGVAFAWDAKYTLGIDDILTSMMWLLGLFIVVFIMYMLIRIVTDVMQMLQYTKIKKAFGGFGPGAESPKGKLF
jgi:hypothetical protein